MLMKVERPSAKEVYSNKFRAKRMEMLMAMVDEVLQKKDMCRILDLGGRSDYWLGLEHMWRNRKIYVTLVDLVPTPVSDPRFLVIQGDACDLPMYADGEFDIVFSNSVIEHVGSWQNKVRMAKEARRLGSRYFIQTPNYWFPVEPHFRALFFHWLPRPWQRALVMRRDFAFHTRTDSIDEADRILNDAALLDHFEMKSLFPDGKIVRERFLGLFTKSLIAVR